VEFRELQRQSSSSLSESHILRGFSVTLSESCLLVVLSQIVFSLSFFLTLFVFLLKREFKPLRDPGYQYQWSLLGFGFSVFFFSEFRYTRGLYKVSPRVHALCLYPERVRTCVVEVTVVCLYMILVVEGKVFIFSLDKNYSSQVFEFLFEQSVD
jgi:hypothetical protein